jgi:hypothetical protein
MFAFLLTNENGMLAQRRLKDGKEAELRTQKIRAYQK